MAADKLTESELALADVVIALFRSLYHGSDKAVKTDRVLFELSKLGYPVKGQSLRAVIGHIRQHDLVSPDYILSDVAYGYWLSSDEREMNDFIDKQMNRMANQFQNVQSLLKRMRYGNKNLQNAQIQLF